MRDCGTVFVLWQFHEPIVVVADAECIKVCSALTESVYIQFIGTLIDEVYGMGYCKYTVKFTQSESD